MSSNITVVLPNNVNVVNALERTRDLLEPFGAKVVVSENVNHDLAEVLLLLADLQIKLKRLGL